MQSFFLNKLLLLALYCCAILAINIQIDGQFESDNKRLPKWQHMSPNISRDVSNLKLRLAAWVEGSRRNSRRNANGKDKQSLNGYSNYSADVSANSSPAASDFAWTPQNRWEQRSKNHNEIVHSTPPQRRAATVSDFDRTPPHRRWEQSKNFQRENVHAPLREQRHKQKAKSTLGSIYLQREFDQLSQSSLSDQNDHFSYESPRSYQTGTEIVEVANDHSNEGNATDHFNRRQFNETNNEIVPIEKSQNDGSVSAHFSHNENGQMHYGRAITVVSDRINDSRADGLDRLHSSSADYTTQKCGIMPKLPNLCEKFRHWQLKMKMDMQLLMHCAKNTKLPRNLVDDHKNNNFFLHEHPGNGEENPYSKLGWDENPFYGKTPSFKSN